MFPLRDTVPTRRFPWLTVGLITLNALIFLYETSLPPRMLEQLVDVFGLVPARFAHWARAGGSPEDPLRFLPVLTSMFLHGGWAHLLGNMWFLWIFGSKVEDVLGPARYLLFYLCCGVVAGLAQVWFLSRSALPTVGASGAIAGVLGAYFWLFPRARILTFIPIFFIPWFVEVPALVFLGVWFVMQVWSALSEVGAQTLHGGVAWWAHAAGFVGGLLLLWMMRPRTVRRRIPA